MINIRQLRHLWRLRPGRPDLSSLTLAGLATAAAVLVVGTSATGATAGGCPDSNPPNETVLVSGSPQTAQFGKAFQNNLQVKLANSNGCPLTGPLAAVGVTFVAPGGGASGTFASSGSNVAYVGTDENGIATAPTLTANHTAGNYGVYAQSNYGSVRFDLTNTASGLPTSIAAEGQASQEATTNAQYAQPLQARVRDADGKPVADVSVNFAIASGPTGASASFLGGAAQATALSDADGLATSPPLVANGTPGRFTASASTAGITTPAVYTLTNHDAATTISATGGNHQRATVSTRYRRPLRVRLLDASGQPIEGATVTFTLGQGSSGASASFIGGGTQANALTDANGAATSPPLIANASPGQFTATAAVAGNTAPASYSLRNLPALLRVATHQRQTAVVAHHYRQPLTARVLASDGAPLEGVSVTFSLGTGTTGAAAHFPDGGTQATATTDASGRARSPLLLANTSAGRFTATAAIAGSASHGRYDLENLAGPPTSISAGAADGESTTVSSPFPVPLAVTVKDANSNPVAGVLVTFTAPATGPGGTFPGGVRRVRVKTNANGIAVAPALTANGSPGGYVVTATVNGLRVAFALINESRP